MHSPTAHAQGTCRVLRLLCTRACVYACLSLNSWLAFVFLGVHVKITSLLSERSTVATASQTQHIPSFVSLLSLGCQITCIISPFTLLLFMGFPEKARVILRFLFSDAVFSSHLSLPLYHQSRYLDNIFGLLSAVWIPVQTVINAT